jgi:enamine deaminase RidA (YjgF/YER057c/UK114 family)
MNQAKNPVSIHRPGGISSHAIEIPANARVLHLSGQIALQVDGSVPPTIEEQTEVVWQRIRAILAEADMAIQDIVKITSYLISADDYEGFAAVRARHVAGHRPASTAVIVAALVKPEFRVEIEVIAAKA